MKNLLLFLLLIVFADAKSVTATFTYAMGDRDTKIEAKKIAFAEAKRMAIEKIGVWIESETNIVDGQMERDKIRSFVLGYARTKILSENFDYPKYTVTVELEIDDEQLKHIPQNGTASQPTAAPAEVPVEKPEPQPAEAAVTPAPAQTGAKMWYSGLEIGALFGSGSVDITTTTVASDESAEKQNIGYGGIKIVFCFDRHHAVEFVGGGGSTELDSGDTLQLNTSGIAYQYHFDRLSAAPVIPYVALGVTNGTAIITDAAENETIYEGSGGMLHAGAKWFFEGDSHHLLEASILLQSFSDETQEPGSSIESVQFSRTVLALGYSYRF